MEIALGLSGLGELPGAVHVDEVPHLPGPLLHVDKALPGRPSSRLLEPDRVPEPAVGRRADHLQILWERHGPPPEVSVLLEGDQHGSVAHMAGPPDGLPMPSLSR
jgi:hypothetical protein